MKKIIKRIFVVTFLFFSLLTFSLDWPQENISTETIHSYFGNLRGNTLSTSLVFESDSQVQSCDKGKIIAVINDYDDETCFFPSTLGNAIIIAHSDELIAVYGNIDKESINQKAYEGSLVSDKEIIGESGNSGWQQGHSSLEFQLIDTQNGRAINPFTLMPQLNEEIPLTLTGIILENRNGMQTELALQRNVSSGTYKIYRRRQRKVSPYKIFIGVNGSSVHEISYEFFSGENAKIYAQGTKLYSSDNLYPNENLQLLGEVRLTRGRNILTLTLVDSLTKETSANYTVNVF